MADPEHCILKYTSFLFITNVLHAFYARNWVYHHLSLSVTCLSLCVHHTGWQSLKKTNPVLFMLDKVTAHTFFMLMLYDLCAYHYRQGFVLESSSMLFALPCLTLMLWFSESVPYFIHSNHILHAGLHATAWISIHLMLILLDPMLFLPLA